MTSISKYLRFIPRTYMTALVMVIGVAVLLYMNHQFTQEFQVFTVIAIFAILLLSAREEKEPISLDEAKQIWSDKIREKRSLGIITAGTIKEDIDGTLRWKNGKPWYYEVCTTTSNPTKPYYVASIDPFNGKIYTSKKLKAWNADMAPSIEVVAPPTILDWLKARKNIDNAIEGEVE